MAAPTNPQPPPSSAPTRVTRETAEKAVKALLKWRKTKSESSKPQLLEEDEFLYLILTLKKIPPTGRTNPYKIPLPHPLLAAGTAELCLIFDDRPRSGLTKADAKKKIKSEGIPVTKVIKFSKMRTDYKPFEAKRKLCDSYDMFFADKTIVPLLPKLIGKVFFRKKKIPVSMNLKHKNWKEQIERACGSGMLFLNTGTCSVVKVAKASMEEDEMVENLVAAIEGVVGAVPKQWDNVRSLNVKLIDSPALALYQTVPDVKLRIEGLRAKEEEVKEEVGEKSSGEKKKKASKKGRIHEVKYMDSVDGDDVVEGDEMVSDGKKEKKKEGKEKGEALTKKAKKDKLGDDENGEAKKDGLKASGGKKRKNEEGKVKSSENGEVLSKKPAKEKKVELEVGNEVASGGKKRKEGEVKSSEDGEALLRRSTRAKKENKKDSIKTKESKKSDNVEVKVKGKTKKKSIAAE